MDSENFPIPEFEEWILQDEKLGMFLKMSLIRAIREDWVITTA